MNSGLLASLAGSRSQSKAKEGHGGGLRNWFAFDRHHVEAPGAGGATVAARWVAGCILTSRRVECGHDAEGEVSIVINSRDRAQVDASTVEPGVARSCLECAAEIHEIDAVHAVLELRELAGGVAVTVIPGDLDIELANGADVKLNTAKLVFRALSSPVRQVVRRVVADVRVGRTAACVAAGECCRRAADQRKATRAKSRISCSRGGACVVASVEIPLRDDGSLRRCCENGESREEDRFHFLITTPIIRAGARRDDAKGEML